MHVEWGYSLIRHGKVQHQLINVYTYYVLHEDGAAVARSDKVSSYCLMSNISKINIFMYINYSSMLINN